MGESRYHFLKSLDESSRSNLNREGGEVGVLRSWRSTGRECGLELLVGDV